MAVTHVNTQTASDGNNTSVTGNKPTGATQNDVFIALVTSNNQTVSPPAGWTGFFDVVNGVFRCQGFYKVDGGSEPSTYAFTVSTGCPLVLTISGWRGVDTADVFDINVSAVASGSQSEPYSTPSLSGTGATQGRVMYLRSVREDGSTPITFTASGVTELADHGVFSGGSVSYSQGLYAATADYNSTSTKAGLAVTASATETNNAAAIWALKAKGSSGAMQVSLPPITSTVSGSVAYPATMTTTLPQLSVGISVHNGTYNGPMDVVMPIEVSVAAIVPPLATLDVAIPLVMSIVGETRRFDANTVHIEREKRWLVIHQDDIEVIAASESEQSELVPTIVLPMPEVEISATTPIGSELPEVFGTVFDPVVRVGPLPDVVRAYVHRVAFAGEVQVYATAYDRSYLDMFGQDIGDGIATSYTVTHNFGSRDVLVAVYETATPYEEVQPTSIEHATTNTTTVTFPSAPSTNQYRVVVAYG